MFTNGDGGKDECRKRSNEKDMRFGTITHWFSIIHHSYFLVDELKECKIQYAMSESPRKPLCCRPLPGKKQKNMNFSFCFLTYSWERSRSAVVVHSCPQCTRPVHTMATSVCEGFVLICILLCSPSLCLSPVHPQSQTTNVAKGVDLLQAEIFPQGLYIYVA